VVSQVGDRLAREHGELFSQNDGGAADLGGALWQDHSEFSKQAADAVDGGGSFFDVALADPVQREDGLLLCTLDRNEAPIGSGDGLADGLGIVAAFLELLRYGATKRAIMMPTRRPSCSNCRAHW
jgi:hypothetical protein